MNIEEGEELKVYLLLLQSFFLGVFFATYEISAFTLFQSTFNQDDLYNSFVVSGIAGVILSLIYSKLQSSLSFGKLANINLSFIVLLMISMWAMNRFSNNSIVIFIAFIMMGPLNAIGQLGFWGMAGRVFNLRQGKRLFGLVDSGQTVGMIIISFSVPFLLMVFSNIGDLMLVSSVSAAGALIFQFISVSKFKEELKDEVTSSETDQNDKGMSILDVIKDKYLSKLALFVVFSMLGAFLIYSSFFDVTKLNYPAENDRAVFLSMFLAVVMIFSFVIKAFLFGKITNMYGIKVSLLLTPVVVGVIALFASILGTVFGYTPEMNHFTLFFLMVCMARLFSHSLSMSIEGPVTKILYQPIDKSRRYDAQSKIDGTVNEFSSVLSGVILIGLSKLTFFKSLHITYVVVALIIVWGYIIVKLYQGYRNTLQETLSQSSNDNNVDNYKYSILIQNLEAPEPDKVIYNLNVLLDLDPIRAEKEIIDLLNHESPSVREFVIKTIVDNKLYSVISSVRKRIDLENDKQIENKLYQALEDLYLNQEQAVTYEYLEVLAKSRDSEQRILATKLVGKVNTRDALMLLASLLRDLNRKVRRQAIVASSKISSPILWPYLLENLNSVSFRTYAERAILEIGNDILPELNEMFNKTDVSLEVQQSILDLFGKIGGEKAQAYLLDKLTHAEPILIRDILKALRETGYQATGVEAARINSIIELTVKNTLWNLAAIEEISNDEVFAQFKNALEEENNKKYSIIFLLLSLNYEPSSIEKIKESLDQGTVESIGYAIELLDLFLAEELKGYLFPLFEDSAISDKLKQMEMYFYRPKYSKREVLLEVLKRDYNTTDSWTKAVAIDVLSQHKALKEIPNELVSCAFHPERLISELALSLIYKRDPKVYQNVGNRISTKEKRKIDQLIAGSEEKKRELVFNKVQLLKTTALGKDLKEDVLVELANRLGRVNCDQEKLLNDFDKEWESFYVLDSGIVELQVKGEKILEFDRQVLITDAISLNSDLDHTQLVAKKGAVVYEIKIEDVVNIADKYPAFVEVMTSQLDFRLGKSQVV